MGDVRDSGTGVWCRKVKPLEWGKMRCEWRLVGLNGLVRTEKTVSTAHLRTNQMRKDGASDIWQKSQKTEPNVAGVY